MAEMIRNWVISLIVIVLFSTIMDMILPNSSIRKYTKFVIGILIILVILTPLVSMVKKGFSLEEEIIQNTFSMEMDDLKYQSLNSEEKYRSSILALYKKKLETQIEYQVNKEPGFENVKAQVIINEDAGNDKYGSIEQILLERKESSSDIKKVEIKVDSSHAESLSSRDGEYDNEAIRKVQETLCNIYDLEPDKVVIR